WQVLYVGARGPQAQEVPAGRVAPRQAPTSQRALPVRCSVVRRGDLPSGPLFGRTYVLEQPIGSQFPEAGHEAPLLPPGARAAGLVHQQAVVAVREDFDDVI